MCTQDGRIAGAAQGQFRKEQMDPSSDRPGISSTQLGDRMSAGNLLIQKAVVLRRQADALNTLGNQIRQLEIKQEHDGRMSNEMLDALMTLLR